MLPRNQKDEQMKKMITLCLLLMTQANVNPSSKKPFGLLLVSSFYGGMYQGLTGLDRYIFNYANFLKNNNIPVAVLVTKGAAIEQSLQQIGVPTATWGFFKREKKASQPSLASIIKKLIESCRLTHVHCNMQHELVMVQKALRKQQLPIFYTHHYQHFFRAEQYPFLAGICVVNKHLEAKIKKITKVPVMFTPPFFDEDHLAKALVSDTLPSIHQVSGVPIITMVGNMYNDLKAKNYPLLVRAVDKLVNQYHQSCHILVVGDGPRRKHIQQLVKDAGLESVITFLGFRKDVPAILAQSDIVVLTSKHEGFGMVLAEANYLGKPTIGAQGTGVEGAIADGVNGLLFKNDCVDDFCDKCLKLLQQPSACKAMGERARVYAREHFANDRIFYQMIQLYGMS